MGEMVVESLPLHKFTVEQFERMDSLGLLADCERSELLGGLIVTLPPIGFEHALRQSRVLQYLQRTIGERAVVVGPISLALGPHDMPEPDLSILASIDYTSRGVPPRREEIYALIEISDSSTRRDMEIKRDLYAHHAIPDYLIIDIDGNELIHFTSPDGGRYPAPRRLTAGDTFQLAAFPGLEFEAASLLAAPR